jgi:hypothetical protein
MRLFDILKKRKPEEVNESTEKINEVEYLPELPPMEFKEMRRILATLCMLESIEDCMYCPLDGNCSFYRETQIWDINETEARHLCEILLKKGVLDYYTDIKINNEDRKEELKVYCNHVKCENCIMANRGSCDFDSMTDNREILALYEAVYYGEIEQAEEYLKQRVQLIGEELMVELPKDVEDKNVKITFVKCDKTETELKERKKGESE